MPVANSTLSSINSSVYSNAAPANDAVQILAKLSESAVTQNCAGGTVAIDTSGRHVKLNVSVNTTLTLPAPQYAGQTLVIECIARSGGNADLTVAGSNLILGQVNLGGASTTVRFDDVNKFAILIAIPGQAKWSLCNCSASTVI